MGFNPRANKKPDGVIKKAMRKFTGDSLSNIALDRYDMTTKKKREINIPVNYEMANMAKAKTVERFKENDKYYMNRHYTAEQIELFLQEEGWDFAPPVLPDPFIQVESLITKDIPSFEFKAKDHRMTQEQATKREQAVNFVIQNNDIDTMNLENERHVNILGTAFWKVSWNPDKSVGGYEGGIEIGNPEPSNIFQDPSSRTVFGCEYIVYEYPLHINAFKRQFGNKITRKQMKEIVPDGRDLDTDIYERNEEDFYDTDTVKMIEYWYRDDDGDIALSVLVGGSNHFIEVKYVEKYWERTRHSNNKNYPIIRYRRIPISKDFWGRGEIDWIKDLVDAGDRELVTALMEDMMSGNDIILAEDDCWAENFKPVIKPGAIWNIKTGKKVTRLGGTAYNGNELSMIEFLHNKIEEVNRNYASSMGKEPQRVTAASGILQLNEKAEAQTEVKSFGRLVGFMNLARMIDYHILEFYDDERMILIHGKTEDGEDVDSFEPFNVQDMAVQQEAVPDFDFTKDLEDTVADESPEEVKQMVKEEIMYFPEIDVSINVGSSLENSKPFTLAMTQELANIQMTPQNAPIIKAMVDLLEIPTGKEIKKAIDEQIQYDRKMKEQELLMQQQAQQQVIPGAVPEALPETNVEEEPTPEELDQLIADLLAILPQEFLDILNTMDEDERMELLAQMIEMTEEELAKFIADFIGKVK